MTTILFCRLLSRRCGAQITRLGVSLWLLASLSGCQVSGQAANPLVTITTGAATGAELGVPGVPAGRGAFLQGRVLGGRQPVQGAKVYVYAASAQNPQLVSEIAHTTTDHLGNFSIGPLTTTPGQGDLVYLVSNRGDAGSGYNPTAQLLSLAGTWDATTQALSYPAVTVNELTTVAIINVLGPSLAMVPCEQLDHSTQTSGTCPKLLNPGDWGSVMSHSYTTGSGANTQQLADGVSDYVNLSNGTLAAKLTFASAPAASASAADKSNYANASVLNMEASVLANCINSKGGKAQDSSACGNLMDDGTNSDATWTPPAVAHQPAPTPVAPAAGWLSEIVPYNATNQTGTYASYTAHPTWGSRNGANAGAAVFSPNGKFFYVYCYQTGVTYKNNRNVNVTGNFMAMCGYSVDHTTGILTALPGSPYQLTTTGLIAPNFSNGLAISPTGQSLFVLVAPQNGSGGTDTSNHIYTLTINADGTLKTNSVSANGNTFTAVAAHVDTTLPVLDNPVATGGSFGKLRLSPDGRLLVLTNSGGGINFSFGVLGYTVQYTAAGATLTPTAWDAANTPAPNLLTLDTDITAMKPLELSFSPDGKLLGVTSANSSNWRLHVFQRQNTGTASDSLAELTHSPLSTHYGGDIGEVELDYVSKILFLNKNTTVAVTTSHKRVELFSLDATGTLASASTSTTTVTSSNAEVTPDGQSMYVFNTNAAVANQAGLQVITLDPKARTQSLVARDYISDSSTISNVVVSPNGRFLVAVNGLGAQTLTLRPFIINAGTPSNSVAALASALLAANHDQSGNLAAQHLYGHMPTHNAVYTPLPTAKPNSIQLTPVQQ